MPLVLRAKCVVVGDSTVGKSAVIQSFISDGIEFPKSYLMNCGVDICIKAVQIPSTDVTVEFFIHDCAGKENFSDYVTQFWHNSSMVVIVYDVTNQESFTSCSKWLNRIVAKKTSPDNVLLGAVVANRIDLEQQRVVKTEAGEKFASANAFDYFETSAKLQKNCEKPFQALAAKFYELYEEKLEGFTTAL